MLPDIKVTLPVIFVVWCVGVVLAFDGWVLLAYPAMWGCVGLLFFMLQTVSGKVVPATSRE
jgi:hypothetical protein